MSRCIPCAWWVSTVLMGGLILLLVPEAAWAQSMLSLQSGPGPGGGTQWSVPVQTLLLFTALSFLPAAVLMMTSFTRIIIVLALVRQALGLPTSPPNQVLIGITLFLTAFIMAPTLDRIHDEAWIPYSEQNMPLGEAAEKASGPLREFMLRQTRAADLELFVRIAGQGSPVQAADAPGNTRTPPADAARTGAGPAGAPALGSVLAPSLRTGNANAGLAEDTTYDQIPLRLLVPAFILSELKTAFQIGFMVYLPFVIIDMVVATVLMAMGMMMVPPVMVSLPFKLILFVLADGWNVLVGSLVASFST